MDDLDERQAASWMKQATAIPGFGRRAVDGGSGRVFDEALGLWRGSPYAEFASEEFAAADPYAIVVDVPLGPSAPSRPANWSKWLSKRTSSSAGWLAPCSGR